MPQQNQEPDKIVHPTVESPKPEAVINMSGVFSKMEIISPRKGQPDNVTHSPIAVTNPSYLESGPIVISDLDPETGRLHIDTRGGKVMP